MASSALIVCVPEAEAWVGGLRERFDPSARQGVPAHITLLYPFVAPERLSEPVLATIRQALAQVAPFDFRLSTVGRFTATAYLAPGPAAPFVDLTRRLVERFPECLPYGGEHQGVIPHLTVAHGNEVEAAIAAAALSGALAERGAIRSTCREVVLLEDSSGAWTQRHAFRLSPSAAG